MQGALKLATLQVASLVVVLQDLGVSGQGQLTSSLDSPGLLKIALGSASLCLTHLLPNQSARVPRRTRGSEASWLRVVGGPFGEKPLAW